MRRSSVFSLVAMLVVTAMLPRFFYNDAYDGKNAERCSYILDEWRHNDRSGSFYVVSRRYQLVVQNRDCFDESQITQSVQNHWDAEMKYFERSVSELKSWGDRLEEFEQFVEIASESKEFLDEYGRAQLVRVEAFALASHAADFGIDNYRVAIEHTRTMSSARMDPQIAAMRRLTEVQIVERAYKEIYTHSLFADSTVREFKQDFPLNDFVEPGKFAEEVGLILPTGFFLEFGLGDEVTADLLVESLESSGWFGGREEIGRFWINKGHDASFVWRLVVGSHVDVGDWQAAMSLAVRELGVQDVNRVEDARIAHLRKQGKWLVIEQPDGTHTRVYPTWDE